MIQQLTHTYDFKQPEWITSMGGYNSLPEPFRPCHEHNFLHMLNIYTPTHMEYRQVIHEGRIRTVHIFWWHERAIAMIMPSKWRTPTQRERAADDVTIVYEEPTLYFHIGCKHERRELSQAECRKRGIDHCGNCWHVEECTLCGHINSYDSSG